MCSMITKGYKQVRCEYGTNKSGVLTFYKAYELIMGGNREGESKRTYEM